MGVYAFRYFIISIAFLILSDAGASIDVTFEGHESTGYFLKTSETENIEAEVEDDNFGRFSSLDRFALLGNSSPVGSTTIKAQYGPFSTRQTIPNGGLFGVDTNENYQLNIANSSNVDSPFGGILKGVEGSDISAHLVVTELKRDNPVLKVLFHSSSAISNTHAGHSRQTKNRFGREHVCITLLVHLVNSNSSLNASCFIDETGTCLAEAVVPVSWWPPMDDHKTPKSSKRMAHVEYFVYGKEQGHAGCSNPRVPAQKKHLVDMPLSTSHGSYEEIRNDEFVSIMVPQTPLYPRSKVYIPVFLQPNPTYPIYVFVIRARVRSGLRILGAQVSQPNKWTINIDLNSKKTIATVTVFVNAATTPPAPVRSEESNQVFSWLLEVDANARYYDTGMITWNLRYVLDASMAEQYDFDDENVKLTARLDIQKDDIQAVLPIAKSSELMNTAMLNGRQVSSAMKVFIVSQSGEVSDVTLQSSCKSADESILKVSSSCTSVYLDGSEVRGSHNASVFVKYGTYTGKTKFIVWMPKIPLHIDFSDDKLGQIKNWKVSRSLYRQESRISHSYHSNSLKTRLYRKPTSNQNNRNKKRQNGHLIDNNKSSMRHFETTLNREEKEKGCRLRYQQTRVEVYAEFLAVDDSSGRESYLISRKTSLKITDLVKNFLRVADTHIASLNGNFVEGRQVGRTEVQVLSPITGRVIGAKEIRVGGDRVTIAKLEASVITGLQMSIHQNPDPNFGYFARTYVSHKLSAKYQEGLLDIKLHFSDGTSTPLNEIDGSTYRIKVKSLDTSVVAFAPMARLRHPRVIAIGPGKGDILQVSLEVPRKCQKKRTEPLASFKAYVNVDFDSDESNPGAEYVSGDDDVQNDSYNFNVKLKAAKTAIGREERPVNDYSGIDYIKRINGPSVQAHQYQDGDTGYQITPLWIGIYALLALFCLAIVVFFISCTVFAVRYRKKSVPIVQARVAVEHPDNLKPSGSDDGESVAHAHDWVWLGRATLERNSVNTGCAQNLIPLADMNGNQPSAHEVAPAVVFRARSSSQKSNPNVDMRITANPHDGSEVPLMSSEKNFSRVPSQRAINVPSWVAAADFQAKREQDKRVRIHPNPIHPHQGVPLPVPIPPSRRLKNINMNGTATFTIHGDAPPPVPPHGNIGKGVRHSEDAEMQDHAEKHSPSDDDNASCSRNKDEIAAAIEGEQPSPCVEDMEQEGDWDSVCMGMDYDQLMEYFDNLKESNA